MIDNDKYYSGHACIYPGEYEPLPSLEKTLREHLRTKGVKVVNPPANIIEQPDHYRIEVAAPGFQREDFFVHTNDRLLSIAAMHKKPVLKQERYRLQSFRCEYIQRNIVLPKDVDTEFSSAEYKNGILCICLSKTTYPIINRPGHIIVY